MTCDDYRAAFLAGEMSHEHRAHGDSCARCRSERATLTAMAEALNDAALWAEPEAGAHARLKDRLGHARSAEGPASRRVWPLWVAAVAAVAVIATALTITLRPDRADWEVAISGIGPAPDGTVSGWVEPSGTRVTFDVPGLEPAPDGQVYELWFSRGGVHVSGGTFTDADGAELWVGVSRRAYPRIWVTLEPLDDDSTPSAAVILDTKPRG